MRPEELGKWISDNIDESARRLNDAAGKSQRRIIAEISELTKEFSLSSGGTIKPTADNLKKLQAVKNRLGKIVGNEGWNKAVQGFTNEFKVIELTINTHYLEEFGNAFSPGKPVFNAIRENAILLTRTSLIESGLSEVITRNLEQTLVRSVTVGMKYRDLIENVTTFLTEKDGRLARWSKQIAMDQSHQYTRNYIQTVSQDINAKWFKYSGGRVEDSREFCIERYGKFWPIDVIRSWSSLPWVGKNPQTTSENIPTLLGGYNCLHTLIPVSDRRVSAERKAEFE